MDSGVIFSVKTRNDEIEVNYTITLTDVASPPAGNNYGLTGQYVFQGGTGIFNGAIGTGTISGTCTSSFDRDDADCSMNWTGTIGAG